MRRCGQYRMNSVVTPTDGVQPVGQRVVRITPGGALTTLSKFNLASGWFPTEGRTGLQTQLLRLSEPYAVQYCP
jgi:hypothetical protein